MGFTMLHNLSQSQLALLTLIGKVITLIENQLFGYLFMLAYGPIIWSSKNKTAIALSSTKVEYRGVVNAATQCLWLQGILGEFGIEFETSTIVYCDNQSNT